MVLNEKQLAIIQGKVCPYCYGTTEYVDSAIIYGISRGMIYWCQPCDAYCGVYNGTDKSLGRLANKELREWKIKAHEYFDMIWKQNQLTRDNAYLLLANHLNISSEYSHIGMFSVKTCKKVVEWSIKYVNDLKDIS